MYRNDEALTVVEIYPKSVAGGGMAEEPIDALATSSRGCVRAWGEDRPKAPMAIRLIVLHSMIVELYRDILLVVSKRDGSPNERASHAVALVPNAERRRALSHYACSHK